jgi:hypothetical protein
MSAVFSHIKPVPQVFRCISVSSYPSSLSPSVREFLLPSWHWQKVISRVNQNLYNNNNHRQYRQRILCYILINRTYSDVEKRKTVPFKQQKFWKFPIREFEYFRNIPGRNLPRIWIFIDEIWFTETKNSKFLADEEMNYVSFFYTVLHFLSTYTYEYDDSIGPSLKFLGSSIYI